jgi:hypothetical protein
MVFDPKTGLLRRLSTFNAGEEIANLHELYDLYDVEGANEVNIHSSLPNIHTRSFLELAASGFL